MLFWPFSNERGKRMNGFFQIGVITGTHGIKGTFKVFPTTDDPQRFELLEEVIVQHAGKQDIFHITEIKYHKKFVLMSVKEIKDINDAECFKNASILIPEEQAIPLEENEYYVRDLYGLKVYTEEGEYLGTLNEVYRTGANDVYGVQDLEKEGTKELLLPAIHQCIKKVDIQEKMMMVKLMEL